MECTKIKSSVQLGKIRFDVLRDMLDFRIFSELTPLSTKSKLSLTPLALEMYQN